MMKFASFETVVEMIYQRLPGTKSDYNKGAQTAVAFSGGYIAGILCAIISHPADVMVSKLNANRLPSEAFGTAMGRIYKDIGFGGLWNGLAVRIVMIGTLVGFSIFRLTQLRQLRKANQLYLYLDWFAMDDVCDISFTFPILVR
jgi:solute carrier family 25 (mitochondrial phosphate transporter), member 3